MPRRRQSDEGGVSLFPFMSILASLIGVLTLLISVNMIMKEQERNVSEEQLGLATENLKLKKKAALIRRENAQLEKRLKEEGDALVELKKIEDAQAALTSELGELRSNRESEQTNLQLLEAVENLQLETEALEKEQPVLQEQRDFLAAEAREKEPRLKVNAKVIVQPTGIGSRTAKNIFFVECHSTGITIRLSGEEPVSISTEAIRTNEKYKEFLEKVQKKRDSMVLFLMRKSGNNAYRWAAGIAEAEFQVSTGKLPVPRDGEIDLSLFK